MPARGRRSIAAVDPGRSKGGRPHGGISPNSAASNAFGTQPKFATRAPASAAISGTTARTAAFDGLQIQWPLDETADITSTLAPISRLLPPRPLKNRPEGSKIPEGPDSPVRRGVAVFRAGAVLACVFVTVLAGCGSDGGTAGSVTVSSGTIGVAMPTTSSPRWVSDGDNMKQQFSLLGYDTDLQYAEDKSDTQVTQIEKMIAAGDKALIVGAVDGTALTDVLAKAATANIPVISYDRLIRDTPNVSYYASFDNYRVGVLQARYLIKRLGLSSGKGPFTIELFAGDPKDNNAGFFFDGAMSLLRPYLRSGDLEVRSGETRFKDITTDGWSGDIAQKRMARILSSDYSSTTLNAVLSPYDGISRGIIAALKKDGYTKMPAITGQDAELDSVKAIVAGTQGETVYKDSRELAKVAVQMADSLLVGSTPEVNDTKQYNNGVKDVPSFLLQPVSVDKSNYQTVLVDGGYYTADQIGS